MQGDWKTLKTSMGAKETYTGVRGKYKTSDSNYSAVKTEDQVGSVTLACTNSMTPPYAHMGDQSFFPKALVR